MRPILIEWGGITIGSYAALLDLGLIVAAIVVWLEARHRQVRSAIWLDSILAAITLGVVLARSVLADHGGSLRYESAPGKGTRVTIRIPPVALRAEGAPAARPPGDRADPAPGEKARG